MNVEKVKEPKKQTVMVTEPLRKRKSSQDAETQTPRIPRKFHYDDTYAKRAVLRENERIYEDALRLGRKFIDDTSNARLFLQSFLSAQLYPEAMIYAHQVLEGYEILIDRLTRGPHHFVIMAETGTLNRFKIYLINETLAYWQSVQNLVCILAAESITNDDDASLHTVVYLLQRINRLYTMNRSKYENAFLHPFSDYILVIFLNNINKFLLKNLCWSADGNIGIHQDAAGRYVWD